MSLQFQSETNNNLTSSNDSNDYDDNKLACEQGVINSPIEHEMQHSYLEYAMNVITARAIPNIRDGLKHSQRRTLYGMYKAGFTSDKPMHKSSKISGEIFGRYHPHSDIQVYDCMVRLIQPFNCNYPLIDGHGNFGSIDGDSPAAQRYTAARLSKLGEYLLKDIDKDTVPFRPNYDGTEIEPELLPARIPNILINGCVGIAVGFATSLPPHNLKDIIDATISLILNSNIDIEDLIDIVQCPDFPTGGVVHIDENTRNMYRIGRGQITLRAKTHIDESTNTIYVTEIPYQVNKSQLVEHIATLVNNYSLDNISDVSDDSSGKDICITIKVNNYGNPYVVLNNLYNMTKLQTQVYTNFVALDGNNPRIFNLKTALETFIQHRLSVVYKRTQYLLHKTIQKLNNLVAVLVAVEEVNDVVDIIKLSSNSNNAKELLLQKEFIVSQATANCINSVKKIAPQLEFKLIDNRFMYASDSIGTVLDLRLSALTSLEKTQLQVNLQQTIASAQDYQQLLYSESKRKELIIAELKDIQEKFGRPRLTAISHISTNLQEADFVLPEQIIITLSNSGYLKSQKLDSYTTQQRGGTGKICSNVNKIQDQMDYLLICNRTDTLLLFSNKGVMYWLKAYHIPFMDRQAKGKPIQNFVSIEEGERITSMLVQNDAMQTKDLIFVTRQGLIKRTSGNQLCKTRSQGLIYINLRENDEVIKVELIESISQMILVSKLGRATRFKLDQLRSTGRNTFGVRGMKLDKNDSLISGFSMTENINNKICIVVNNGKARVNALEDYPLQKRAGKGIKLLPAKTRLNIVAAIKFNKDQDAEDLLLLTKKGLLTRIKINSIPTYKGRRTIGVNVMNIQDKDTLLSAQLIS